MGMLKYVHILKTTQPALFNLPHVESLTTVSVCVHMQTQSY